MRAINLRAIRLDRGMTEGDMAAELGVSRGKLAHVEHGRQSIDAADAIAWAAEYGVTVRELCEHLRWARRRRDG